MLFKCKDTFTNFKPYLMNNVKEQINHWINTDKPGTRFTRNLNIFPHLKKNTIQLHFSQLQSKLSCN